jgi:pimeloyl-ACP methyl ester carboxylesterase
MPFEHKRRPLLPRKQFYIRVLRFAGFSFLLIGFSLGIGVLGYHFLSDLPWLDSLLNASMILTGMGPVDPMPTIASKWFASFYAIYSGVAFLSIVAVFLSPIVHRFLHRLHLNEDEQT